MTDPKRHARPDAETAPRSGPAATTPANASGSIPTVTITAPLGTATGKASASGTLGAWGTDAWRADDAWGAGDEGGIS